MFLVFKVNNFSQNVFSFFNTTEKKYEHLKNYNVRFLFNLQGFFAIFVKIAKQKKECVILTFFFNFTMIF